MNLADIRIRTKLVAITVVTATLVLVLAVVAMTTTVNRRTRDALVTELHTLASTVGWNTAAALAFSDSSAAHQTIAALDHKPSVVAAYLYDNTGTVFASYVRDGRNPPGGLHLTPTELRSPGGDGDRNFVAGGRMHVLDAVVLDDERYGTLHLVDDLSVLEGMRRSASLVAAVIILVATVLVTLISSRLQRLFSDPVHRLIDVMHGVTASRDYGARVEVTRRDEFGELARVFNSMLEEVAERDRQLEEHSEQLEAQVAQRTEELEQAVFNLSETTAEAVRARREAEAASRAKSEFLATMSHEIRTPMNGVLGMAELLTASELTPRQQRFARAVQNSGIALLDVINNILDFSKIESGHLGLEVHDFHLGDLCEDVTDLMFEQAERKGLEILLAMPAETRRAVRGDSHRIRQVLVNLVGNAIKFTSEGHIVIRVTPRQSAPGRLAIRCQVEDTGIGIPPEVQERIFQAFAQADSSTTRQYGGTGLGLAICQQLVALMGGRMGVDSHCGAGATFWFEIDLERSAGAGESDLADLAGKRMLVVDDGPLNREILAEFAASWQMGFAGVGDAESALAAIRDGTTDDAPWDVVLLDMDLPDRDGLALAAAIRELPEGRDLPLILLSSLQRDPDGALAAAGRLDRYLDKPIRKRVLGEALAGVLGQAAGANVACRPAGAENPAPVAGAYAGRILVAEDNPVNQEVIGGMLDHFGIDHTIVDCGQAALTACRDAEFALVLMDCHMPNMDGFAATRAIRQTEGDGPRHVPVIALTANVQKDVRAQCAEAGMDGYLSKPFSWSQLTELCDRWLVRNDAPAAPVAAVPAVPAKDPACGPAALVRDESVLDKLRVIQRPDRPDIVAGAIARFAETFGPKCAEIEDALASGRADELVAAAHFLKSGSASIGAMAMSQLCRELERHGRDGDLAGARAAGEAFASCRDATAEAFGLAPVEVGR